MLLEERLKKFCKLKKISFPKERLDKGHSSFIFLTSPLPSNKNKLPKQLVIKIERDDSTRKNMLEREAKFLKIANKHKIGPKLFSFSRKYRALLMQYIKGIPFSEYVFQAKPSDLKKTIFLLLKQAEILDKIGLDHGQLAGRGKNILVEKTKPYIIDFEKASTKRKAHNYNVLMSFLFKSKHSSITKEINRKINSLSFAERK